MIEVSRGAWWVKSMTLRERSGAGRLGAIEIHPSDFATKY
jgi:hypothetical protein